MNAFDRGIQALERGLHTLPGFYESRPEGSGAAVQTFLAGLEQIFAEARDVGSAPSVKVSEPDGGAA